MCTCFGGASAEPPVHRPVCGVRGRFRGAAAPRTSRKWAQRSPSGRVGCFAAGAMRCGFCGAAADFATARPRSKKGSAPRTPEVPEFARGKTSGGWHLINGARVFLNRSMGRWSVACFHRQCLAVERLFKRHTSSATGANIFAYVLCSKNVRKMSPYALR